MNSPEQAMLLSVFTGECDRHKGKPIYEAIVLKARELHMAGATVIRGMMGFKADRSIQSSKILELSQDLPVIIELIDTQENIDKLLPFIDEILEEGIVTLESVNVIMSRNRNKAVR